MSGITQAMQKFGRREFLSTFCDQGYTYLRSLDKVYSDWLCVRTSIKVTSVKPSGTVSLLAGVTPGIHFPHSEYYIRRVRLQENSPLVETLAKAGYPVEKDSYSPNTLVATFPVHEEHFDRSKDDLSMWEQLELAAQMQHWWADNQVSVTVTFRKDEAKDIKYALELYETRLKGVSFLPVSEHGYAQAPYETIRQEEYDALMSKITPLSTDSLVHEETSRFCDGDSCTI
jgi:ribonucleotide reductase alpha subunit